MGSPTFWQFVFFQGLFLARLTQGLLLPDGGDLPMVHWAWGELKLCSLPAQSTQNYNPTLSRRPPKTTTPLIQPDDPKTTIPLIQ